MSIEYLLQSFGAVSALGIVGWLFRNWISTRLARSVGYEFDQKIEMLKAELRASEERLRADIRAKEAEIASLRVSAMTALSNRQIEIDKRRLEAIDQLWASITSLNKARGVSLMMSSLKFEAVAERAENDHKMREFLKLIGAGFDISKDLNLGDASKARPFVSPLAWAIYAAIVAIISSGVMRWHVALSGLGAKDFTEQSSLSNMIKAALPEYSGYVDEHGASGLHFLLDKLELKLLEEFRVIMSGAEADRASVQQAAEILKYSEELAQETPTSGAKPFIDANDLKRATE